MSLRMGFGRTLSILALCVPTFCLALTASMKTAGEDHTPLAMPSKPATDSVKLNGFTQTPLSEIPLTVPSEWAGPQPQLQLIHRIGPNDSLTPDDHNWLGDFTSVDRAPSLVESSSEHLFFTLRSRQLVAFVAFSSDGTMLAAASGSSIELWNLTARHEIGSFRFPSSTAAIQRLVFSPDNSLIAVSPVRNGIGLWNIKSIRRSAL
jgi:WD40 repeat protein